MEFLHSLILFLLGLVSAVYIYFRYSFTYWRSKGVVYIEPIFPYGSIKGFGTKLHSSEFMQQIYNKYHATHRFVGLYFFAKPALVIADLELIKTILVRDFEYFTDRLIYYNKEDDPISAHLFTLDGPEWRILRPKLTSIFTSGKMKFMFPTVVEVGHKFRDTLLKKVRQNDEIEIKDVLARFTTDVIGTCVFGVECNSLDDPKTEFREMGLKFFEQPRHGQFVMAFLTNFRELGRKLHIKQVPDEVAAFFSKIVYDTIQYREENNVHRNDLMDLLIKLKNEPVAERQLTMDEVAAQAFVFFAAGYETSSTTLAYCLFELAQDQKVQQKAREEIRQAFEKHNGVFTYEMMADMPYVDCVLNETLRKYPAVSNLTRAVKKRYTIPDSDVVLDEGVRIFLPIYAIHRNPEYYPDPEKFDPERFNSENVKERPSMAWLPFGGGPRNCIGLRFGMVQARVGLVNILNHFEVSLSSRTESDTAFEPALFILTAIGGINLKLKILE